ncbi:hypothetical protein B0H13DRAFT_2145129 [Mycena leptocephala]|nr:hypothetical protein B0H13DRAFT_2145129 [Mycena leptocephala]
MESPFQSILYTNIAPTEGDCERIRDFLDSPRKELLDLAQQIEQRKRLLEELERKRDELVESIDAHLALVSPARRLPVDAVRAIFAACMSTTRNAVISPRDSPLLLCQICSAWRHLALSTPQLWAALHIVVPSGVSKANQLAETVTSWLSRSGVLPLPLRRCIACLAAVAAFCLRWKNIRISTLTYYELNAFAHISVDDVPLLHTFSVGSSATMSGALSDEIPSPWRSLSMLTTPSLRRVSISSGYHFLKLRLPWTQLTHLKIEDNASHLTLHTALTILQQCQGLETCELRISSNDTSGLSLASVTLPHLWHFAFANNERGWIPDAMLEKLILPNLQSLKYSRVYEFDRPPPFAAFAQQLQRLSLDLQGLSTRAVVEILHLMPLLRDLELHREPLLSPEGQGYRKADPEFLEQFVPRPGEAALCPQLRSLKVINFAAASDEALLGCILGRTGSERRDVAQLAHFTAHLNRVMGFDILDVVQP